jgi:hypothetical protein
MSGLIARCDSPVRVSHGATCPWSGPRSGTATRPSSSSSFSSGCPAETARWARPRSTAVLEAVHHSLLPVAQILGPRPVLLACAEGSRSCSLPSCGLRPVRLFERPAGGQVLAGPADCLHFTAGWSGRVLVPQPALRSTGRRACPGAKGESSATFPGWRGAPKGDSNGPTCRRCNRRFAGYDASAISQWMTMLGPRPTDRTILEHPTQLRCRVPLVCCENTSTIPPTDRPQAVWTRSVPLEPD